MAFDLAKHEAIVEGGRVLLRSSESVIAIDEPFLLAAHSEGRVVDIVVRRVTTFAFVLCLVIGALVALRAAPRLLVIVVTVWLVASVVARLLLRKWRREHGKFLIDFDGGTLSGRTAAGEEVEFPLSVCKVRTVRSADSEAPIWILFIAQDARKMRIGRGPEDAVDRVLATLRRHHLPVEREHETVSS